MKTIHTTALLLFLCCVASCSSSSSSPNSSTTSSSSSSTSSSGGSGTGKAVDIDEAEIRQLLNVPDHFNLPFIPATNIPTAAKIDLGRHLFYDKKLSGNQTQACSSCHEQKKAFSDGEITPKGSTGTTLVRNSQGLANSAYHASLTWASDGLLELENQLKVPITGSDPIELGVTEAVVDEVITRFDDDPMYVEKFSAAFPDTEPGASLKKIILALASFCRSLTSGNSAFDQFSNGDFSTLTQQQQTGLSLMYGEKFECFHCHDGQHFSLSYRDHKSNLGTQTYPFFNNGLYNVNGQNKYPELDQGLFELTQNPENRGFFRPPSLRNIAVTAPYMHDGSIATLREVVKHYVRGGTVTLDGPNKGDGRNNLYISEFVRPFEATDAEIDAVVSFLEALTDYDFLENPDFSNPFEETN